MASHIDFVHVRIDPAEAAFHTPHMRNVQGAAIGNALRSLADAAEARVAAAEANVREFCSRAAIPLVDAPCPDVAVTARWRIENGTAIERLLAHARQNDLTIMSRIAKSDGLPQDRLETVLLGSGRPLLIPAADQGTSTPETVMMCWRDTPEAVRALAVSLPILQKARRVVIVTVDEGKPQLQETLDGLSGQLGWRGIRPDVRIVPRQRRSIHDALSTTAREEGAQLLVMGGYGHRRVTELLFGGATLSFIEKPRSQFS